MIKFVPEYKYKIAQLVKFCINWYVEKCLQKPAFSLYPINGWSKILELLLLKKKRYVINFVFILIDSMSAYNLF